MMRVRGTSLILLLAIAACGDPSNEADQVSASSAGKTGVGTPVPSISAPKASLAVRPVAVETVSSGGILSCRTDRGAADAEHLVRVCRAVSPATRPPCNADNSCAMIEDEIARSCALFDGDGAPMAGCEPAPKSMTAAAAVVRRYYSAINARDFDTAWDQWGENGQPGQTRAAFEAGFASTRAVRVTIGRLEPADVGAGSVYQAVPVTVNATLADGSTQRYTGRYVVRRVNGVDGASPVQLRWHIGSGQLNEGAER